VRGLTGPEIGNMVALVDELFDPDELDMLLRIRLDKKFRNLHKGGTYEKQVFDAVLKANAQGWTIRWLEAMVASRPENDALRVFATTVGAIAPDVYRKQLTDHAPGGHLEQFVRAGNLVRWADFTANLLQVQRSVCSIKLSGDKTSYGTGFLVGPDLLLTNHHVIKPVLEGDGTVSDLHFRFDYTGASPDLDYHLTAERVEVVAHRPPADLAEEHGALSNARPPAALDYVLLRLPDPLGDQPFGPRTNAVMVDSLPARGWLPLPAPAAAPTLYADDDLLIAQHPNGRSLRIGMGQILAVSDHGDRFRYNTNTDGGASGAPCFNAKLEAVGLHHYGSEEGGFNQGIPLAAIVADLVRKGVSLNYLSD
jgi:hypothetical protein